MATETLFNLQQTFRWAWSWSTPQEPAVLAAIDEAGEHWMFENMFALIDHRATSHDAEILAAARARHEAAP